MSARDGSAKFQVAAVQATPVFLDREATIAKACELTATAAAQGARLVVFPEAFVPNYPDWVWTVPPGDDGMLRELYAELLDQSVAVPSEATRKLCEAAKRARAYLVVGVNERNTEASSASLYNTLLYIDAQGQLLGKHRKLIPTGGERLVWAQGDGSTLQVYDTPLGKLGGLICWENYMPLARYAMYAWGTQIYVASTWDSGEPWLSTLRHIAKEGGVYVIGCCIAMRKDDLPARHAKLKKKYYAEADDWINVGDSAIVDPDGSFIAGPVGRKEEILYAELDTRQMRAPKGLLDVAGHFARPDVFQLTVQRGAHPMIKVEEDQAAR